MNVAAFAEDTQLLENKSSTGTRSTESVRIWFVHGKGTRDYDSDYGFYFTPKSYCTGVPFNAVWYLGYTFRGKGARDPEIGIVLGGVLWKKASRAEEFDCHFIGHMGLSRITGLYVVTFYA